MGRVPPRKIYSTIAHVNMFFTFTPLYNVPLSNLVTSGFQVHLVSEHIWCDDYLVRSFFLKNLQTNETRTVTQFHFLTWQDLGIPGSIKALLDFRRSVYKSGRVRGVDGGGGGDLLFLHCTACILNDVKQIKIGLAFQSSNTIDKYKCN